MFRPTGVTILGVLVYICAASLFIAGIVSVVGGIALIPSHVPDGRLRPSWELVTYCSLRSTPSRDTV
jgi:hypothetical protein